MLDSKVAVRICSDNPAFGADTKLGNDFQPAYADSWQSSTVRTRTAYQLHWQGNIASVKAIGTAIAVQAQSTRSKRDVDAPCVD